MSTTPIRLASRLLICWGLFALSFHARDGLTAWLTLALGCVVLAPGLMVTVEDEDRDVLVQAFRDALLQCGVSLKEAAYQMGLHSPADLLHALARERQCDLFFRMCKLQVEVRRTFHLNCVVALGLPTRTKRMLKIAAAIEPLAVERSA